MLKSVETASVQPTPKHRAEIARRVAGAEEVQVTLHDPAVARVVSANPVTATDFPLQATAVLGGAPAAKLVSTVFSEARGGER